MVKNVNKKWERPTSQSGTLLRADLHEEHSSLSPGWSESVPRWSSILSPPLLEGICQKSGVALMITDSGQNQVFISSNYRSIVDGGNWIALDPFVVDISDISIRVNMIGYPESDLSELGKLALIGEVSIGLGHDVRNMLTAIYGVQSELRFLAEESSPGDVGRRINLLCAELDASLEVIRGLCGRVESLSSQKPDLRLVGVENLIESTLGMCRHQFSKAKEDGKNISIESSTSGNLCVNTVYHEVQMAMLNIITNAIHHAYEDGGSGTITVSGYSSGGNAYVSIHNDGAEIPVGIRDSLLSQPVASQKGHGYGLYTAASSLARSGCQLTFESGPQGTTFYILLGKELHIGNH